jgi:hypothetical protein
MMTRPQILDALRATRADAADVAELTSLGFPQHYLDVAREVGVQTIASDFVLPPTMHIIVENLRVGPRVEDWLVFAVSASGDGWLMSKRAGDDRVAFLALDATSTEPPLPLGITLDQWFELALFMRDYEAKSMAASEPDKRKLKQKAKAFFQALSPHLFQNYPYAL